MVNTDYKDVFAFSLLVLIHDLPSPGPARPPADRQGVKGTTMSNEDFHRSQACVVAVLSGLIAWWCSAPSSAWSSTATA